MGASAAGRLRQTAGPDPAAPTAPDHRSNPAAACPQVRDRCASKRGGDLARAQAGQVAGVLLAVDQRDAVRAAEGHQRARAILDWRRCGGRTSIRRRTCGRCPRRTGRPPAGRRSRSPRCAPAQVVPGGVGVDHARHDPGAVLAVARRAGAGLHHRAKALSKRISQPGVRPGSGAASCAASATGVNSATGSTMRGSGLHHSSGCRRAEPRERCHAVGLLPAAAGVTLPPAASRPGVSLPAPSVGQQDHRRRRVAAGLYRFERLARLVLGPFLG
jgi:hypothetical protein